MTQDADEINYVLERYDAAVQQARYDKLDSDVKKEIDRVCPVAARKSGHMGFTITAGRGIHYWSIYKPNQPVRI